MTIALLSLTFQGEPTVVGSLEPETMREAQREAFPRSPRRDALSDPTYCAFKSSPLRNGQLLLSVTRNPGTTDAHGRPALQSSVCVLDKAAVTSPARDPVAVWTALRSWTREQSADTFLASAASHSAWESDNVFARVREAWTKEGAFLGSLAAALASGKVTIGSTGEDLLAYLHPALALLPASRLFALEFASGAVDAEGREAAVATTQRVDVQEAGGLLGGLLKRKPAATADLQARKVGGAGEGPKELVKSLVDPQDWPGISARERFRVLMASLDIAGSAFDVSPQLQAMRETVRQVEKLTHDLEGWR